MEFQQKMQTHKTAEAGRALKVSVSAEFLCPAHPSVRQRMLHLEQLVRFPCAFIWRLPSMGKGSLSISIWESLTQLFAQLVQ